MKTKFMYLALAVAMMAGLSSCSNDDADNAAGKAKDIRIQLPDNVVLGTRAVEAPVSTGTSTFLNDVTVFLLNGNAVVGAPVDFLSTEISLGQKDIQNVSASVNGVLVVANIPAADVAAVKALTSSAAIENYPYTISGQSATGITNKLHMGRNTAAFTLGTSINPGVDYYETTVNLNAITARFEIGNVTAGTGIANVKLEGVWINNYPATWMATPTNNGSISSYWAITPAANMGSTTPVVPTTIPAYSPIEYYNPHSTAVNGTTDVYAFTLFAGNYVPHIVMLVSGEYATGYYTGADKHFLGWLTYNKFTDSGTDITSVVANTIYKVGLGGIAVTADAVTVTPEQNKVDLGITITVTPWTEKNVIPGIQ